MQHGCNSSVVPGSDVRRTCAEVLEAVDHWRARGLEVRLSASYVELFGSEVPCAALSSNMTKSKL